MQRGRKGKVRVDDEAGAQGPDAHPRAQARGWSSFFNGLHGRAALPE